MISICMAYYSRPRYLKTTLGIYYTLYKKRNDIEFVIVDDGSPKNLEALPIIEQFKNKLNIRHYYRHNKDDINPAVAINMSVKEASSDVVLITCPEIFPLTPFLPANISLMLHDYVLMPCYSLGQEFQNIINNLQPNDILEAFKIKYFNTEPIKNEGDDGWYAHPAFRPVLFYFSALIHKKYFFDIGGIDEDFRYGWGYEDTEFVHRIKQNNTQIWWMNSHIFVHQNHYTDSAATRDSVSKQEGWRRNYNLFLQKTT